MNRLTLKEKISGLVEGFTKENLKDINEAETRLRFINPFFESLGWNILDPKEVKIETATAKQTSTRPDYRFLINRNTKFFVEAKKPAVKLTDLNPIFQAKSYGFSAKVPLVILTDFEEFRPFKSIARPKLNLPLDGLIKEYDFKYIQYVDEFDKLYDTFSREAVSAGELEKKFTITKTENLTTVDKEFLNDLSNWQEELAKNISLRNPKLKVPEINEAVQRILDRIIFIRICEDREIEDKKILLSYISNDGIYRNLLKEFRRMRAKYNGLLFNEHQLSENLSIDDKILKTIIKTLYPPNSPYRFDEIPIEILGTIYEQFLGKVITLTPTHRAKVEVKPEVRKAGGVFYTPQYIVKYIVKNTVGKLIENANPSEIAKLRFADIACGSGSFLLEMFQVLIDHHIDYYSTHQEEIKKVDGVPARQSAFSYALRHAGVPDAYQDETGLWHLSTRKKKEILLNNIYGVDIDPQAVEVSTMSLYLKLLEGENAETFSKQLKLEMKETILPNLANNIKCGNSLIGTDILDTNKNLFGSEIDLLKIRPFDWQTAFPEIMTGGGFDAIVGNPPYVKIQMLQETNPIVVDWLKHKYQSASTGNYDIYIVFVERAIQLLKKNGKLGYILPHKFFNQGYGRNLRELLGNQKLVERVIHFEDVQIFENASTYTCLFFVSKSLNKTIEVAKVNRKDFKTQDLDSLRFETIDHELWGSNEWNIQSGDAQKLLFKLKKYQTLEQLTTNIFQGPKSGADDVFIFQLKKLSTQKVICYSKAIGEDFEIEKDIIRKYIKGKFIRPYLIDYSANEYTIYPYDDRGKLLSQSQLEKDYPLAFEYLSLPINKKTLLAREDGRFSKQWWSYSRPQNMGLISEKKILTPFNAFKNSFALDYVGDFIFSAGVSGAYGILLKNGVGISYEYLLGILNSPLTQFVIMNTSTVLRGAFYSYENKYISNLPIRTIDFNNPDEKATHDRMVKFVDRMLELHKHKQQAKSDSEKELFEHQIKATDREIDSFVYKLYNITEEERKIIEGIGTDTL